MRNRSAGENHMIKQRKHIATIERNTTQQITDTHITNKQTNNTTIETINNYRGVRYSARPTHNDNNSSNNSNNNNNSSSSNSNNSDIDNNDIDNTNNSILTVVVLMSIW